MYGTVHVNDHLLLHERGLPISNLDLPKVGINEVKYVHAGEENGGFSQLNMLRGIIACFPRRM